MNRVQLSAVPPQPWRNGGGSTRELLAWPAAADWKLRVSLATIAQDGAFSAFAGVDRWFAVVDGAGVTLALPDGDSALTSSSAPQHFAGEAAPHARLRAGATQDLNFMVRRDAGTGEMRCAAAGSAAPGHSAWRGLFSADVLTLEVDGTCIAVDAGTLLWSASLSIAKWRVQEATRAWWLTWNPR